MTLSPLKVCDGFLFWKQPAIFLRIDLTQYFKRHRKSRKGKHMKSRDTYFQQGFHSAFTVSSNIRIIKTDLTSGKITFQFSEL